ncbi:DUF6344 domain-containing protein [Streptomyces sp. YS415]|uniref:DUF6344 domain-containing protein n=1 Tax=Streptomyces sp. YS415 TaxID=2944806 RepID=UPI0020222564|nr:DUF6344 domain-containing protein [Streptomyces sp. YS415]MCL7426203.1 DUF6344 domain-containing protein [Streptomyces sp. YS415]
MARNKVMTLWTAIVTAFLALCTALGLVTTTAAAAVPPTESARTSGSDSTAQSPVPAMSLWAWSYARSLPPTMKQRIRAEAHGKTPSCRHHADTEADPEAEAEAGPAALDCDTTDADAATRAAAEAETPVGVIVGTRDIPLQR